MGEEAGKREGGRRLVIQMPTGGDIGELGPRTSSYSVAMSRVLFPFSISV